MGMNLAIRLEIDNKFFGLTYYYLTIIERNDNYKKEHNIKSNASYYKCRCKCGNFKTVRITAITSGEVKSCGCLKKEQEKKNLVHGYNLIDLTNQQFGLLTAKNKIGSTKDGDALWNCNCICGKTRIVRSSSLRKNSCFSCGCETMSSGELKIKQLLEENQIFFLYDETYFKDLILPSGGIGRYDFILLDKNNQPFRIVEFDGRQHFESIDFFGGEKSFKQQKINDAFKNEYALKNHYILIRIPYWRLEKLTIEDILSDKFEVKNND